MEKILENIAEIIETYESGSWQSVENLRVLLRRLTANNYQLSKHNIEYFRKYNEIQYRHKGAIGRGKILAEEQVPELRMTRKIMESARHVIDAIRSELSIIKNEQ